jgi:hypothetical protein
MKIKNLVIYGDDQTLRRLRHEYETYLGFDCTIEGDKLTIYALPRRRQ